MALVIGYGNPLRGDDAVGQHVASAVADWGLPMVTALAVHQLTPELAAPLAVARLAVFVDARPVGEGEGCLVQRLEPACTRVTIGHDGHPRSLLALARAAYGHHPRSWLVTIPATNFALGSDVSPTARGGMEDALRQIARLLGDAPRESVGVIQPASGDWNTRSV
jgi:hydrogenase maturation protease